MSMTREEAIKYAESKKMRLEALVYSDDCKYGNYAMYSGELSFVNAALSALLPVSREQVKKVFFGCEYCDEEWGTCSPATNRFTMPPNGGIRFCPMCGRPFTDEAVEMVMERLEALNEDNGCS